MRKGDTVSEEPLENLVHEGRTFPPPPDFAAQANGTADLYDAGRGRPRGLLGRAGPDVPHVEQALRRSRSTGATRPSRSGSPTASSTRAYNAVDRHVEAGHGDKVAIHFDGEPEGDTRDHHVRRPARRGPAAANALADLGVAQGRPRRDLPADDPRGRRRDARLRPHRRPALGRLRRLLRRGAAHRGSTTPRPRSSSPPTAATAAASPRRSSRPSTRPSTTATRRSSRSSSSGAPGRTRRGTTTATSGGTTSSSRPPRPARGAVRSTASTRCSSSTPPAPPGSPRASSTPPAAT